METTIATKNFQSKSHFVILYLDFVTIHYFDMIGVLPSFQCSDCYYFLHCEPHKRLHSVSVINAAFLLLFFSKFMRTECMNSRYAYDKPLPVSRLVNMVANSILLKLNIPTCKSKVVSTVYDRVV